MAKIGRNESCPCGSGKKYKKCCQRRHVADGPDATRIATGYRHMMSGHSEEACDSWWKVWGALRPRLRPDMRTIDQAKAIYPDAHSLMYNWVQDFAQELGNAARRHLPYAERGAQFCREVIEQFHAEDELFVQNFRADLGEFYMTAGRFDDGEREMQALVRDYPDHAIGYVRFSTALLVRRDRQHNSNHLERACDLLQQAHDRPVSDGADFDLDERLANLRRDLETQSSSGSATTNQP